MTDRRWFWLLVALAVGSRVAAVVALRSHEVPNSTYEHGAIAANLLAGRGFSVRFLGAEGPTSQQAPVYPALVAGAYAVGGVGTPLALLVLELGQAALGGLLVAGVVMLAREVAPGRRWVWLAAGLVSAVHPTLVYASTHVQVALPAAVLLVWTLAVAYGLGRTGGTGPAFATGLLLALLVLTDPILALAVVGVVLAVVQGRGGVRRAVRPLAVVGLTAVVGCVPWVWRNYQVHGELVFVKSSFGYAFWQGNCAVSQGTDKVVRPSVERALADSGGGFDPRRLNATLWKARHVAGYIDDVALTADDYRRMSVMSEPDRSRWLFARALADLRAEPGRYPRLCLRRLGYFLFFDETNPKTRTLLYRVPHLGLTVAAAVGLLVGGRGMRRRLGPTLATAALIAAFHVLTIVSARFHVPLEPLMGLWAACGLAGGGRAEDRPVSLRGRRGTATVPSHHGEGQPRELTTS